MTFLFSLLFFRHSHMVSEDKRMKNLFKFWAVKRTFNTIFFSLSFFPAFLRVEQVTLTYCHISSLLHKIFSSSDNGVGWANNSECTKNYEYHFAIHLDTCGRTKNTFLSLQCSNGMVIVVVIFVVVVVASTSSPIEKME